jgi:uncharacterized membrane protein
MPFAQTNYYYQETAAGICHTWYWLESFIVIKMFHLMLSTFGMFVIFIIISCICIGSAIFCVFFVPEAVQKNKDSQVQLSTFRMTDM